MNKKRKKVNCSKENIEKMKTEITNELGFMTESKITKNSIFNKKNELNNFNCLQKNDSL